jgi:23S rRNA (adenine2030-N6)-methyltransferase
MNYRHAYHAGNFADVLKHALLCWIVRYLQRKEAPLVMIDTHAGAGSYDLTAPEAGKTGEANDGILRLVSRAGAPPALGAYLDLVRAANRANAAPTIYPGSPSLLAALARAADRVVVCERHPDDAAALTQTLHGNRRVRVVTGDGYRALLALVPPAEKRGVVLVDPPFEEPEEFDYLARMFVAAHRKWPTGVYLLWYPLKERDQAARFTAEIAGAGIRKLACVTLDVDRNEGLSAMGLVLCNAPYTLEQDWAEALPWLAAALAQGPGAAATFERLTPH